jgi:hypothetical protein
MNQVETHCMIGFIVLSSQGFLSCQLQRLPLELQGSDLSVSLNWLRVLGTSKGSQVD